MPSHKTSEVEPGQLRVGPSGTTYKVLSLHGGYCEIVDAVRGGLVQVGDVLIGEMQFSSSIANVESWPLAMCAEEHDEPVPATTMWHEEDDKTVWLPACSECAEHAV